MSYTQTRNEPKTGSAFFGKFTRILKNASIYLTYHCAFTMQNMNSNEQLIYLREKILFVKDFDYYYL